MKGIVLASFVLYYYYFQIFRLKRDVDQLSSDIDEKCCNEKRLNDQINALKGTVDRLSAEIQDYKRLNMSVNTQATNATEYLPIRINNKQRHASAPAPNETLADLTPDDSILTEGSLPDSEIMEMDSRELENLKLRQLIKDLEEKLVKTSSDKNSGHQQNISGHQSDLDISIGIEENQNEMQRLEEKIEEISKEREDQLMAKNDQIDEIEAIRSHEKNKARAKEEQLRTKIRELQIELDKQTGFDPDNEDNSDVRDLNEKNDFLIRQAEEFAEELEKTINAEEEVSKENIMLIQQVNALKTELDSLKARLSYF